MARLTFRAVGATILAVAGCAVAGTASAAAAPAVPAATPGGTGFSVIGGLSGVAATSAANAWAVGSTTHGGLILHWNGKAWSKQAAPAGEVFTAVAASSASNAWAVGSAGSFPSRTLILHWNGRSWRRVPSPSPAYAMISAVATTSAGNAWAVGEYLKNSRTSGSLLLHWNGRKWAQVAAPNVTFAANQGSILQGVSALSASDVWASGSITSDFAGPQRGLMLHFNGRRWSQVRASALATGGTVTGVAAASARSVWAIGCACAGGPDGAPTMHWNGRGWTALREPFVNAAAIGGVIAAAGGSVWAAGRYCTSHCIPGGGSNAEFLMRWTGRGWQLTSHPAIPMVAGLAVTSAGNAWAVGTSTTGKTVILHWNGRAWR